MGGNNLYSTLSLSPYILNCKAKYNHLILWKQSVSSSYDQIQLTHVLGVGVWGLYKIMKQENNTCISAYDSYHIYICNYFSYIKFYAPNLSIKHRQISSWYGSPMIIRSRIWDFCVLTYQRITKLHMCVRRTVEMYCLLLAHLGGSELQNTWVFF